jgi:cellulose synthase/poly-beta-1,6-N-acetylglucosamine synthase-like glycosyltransferase
MRSSFADDHDPSHVPLFVVFSISLAITWFYSVWRWKNLLHAVISTKFFTDNPGDKGGKILPGQEPHVTIQICSYNEGSVVKETINRACSVDWPINKLTVQILDDSTDPASKDVIKQCASLWRSRGIDVAQLTRSNRVGYKAGSLRHHFDSVKGELVVQLDADHRLEPDFLRRAIPFFFDKNGVSVTTIGLVQAPWSFYNIHQNLLTESDALALDVHHVNEQTGRAAAFGFFGFNGTGGVLRKTAIEAAGGWKWDSVTEDLALSYDAAMEGFRFVYVRDMPQLLEVPGTFSSHIQQKHRWTKGFAQVFRFRFWKIVSCSTLSPVDKWDILCHVTSQLQYTSLLIGLLLFPYVVLHGLIARKSRSCYGFQLSNPCSLGLLHALQKYLLVMAATRACLPASVGFAS